MFERFTESARSVVVRAQHEADGLGHNYLGTEHLLLGLVSDEGPPGRALRALGLSCDRLRGKTECLLGDSPPVGSEALAMIGIDLDEVRRRVEAAFGPGALERTRTGKRLCRERPLTCRAKKALELSLREALARGEGRVGSEHVLLALLRTDEGLAIRLLEDCGFSRDQVRLELLRELNGS